jgi:hypothetical protein
VSCRSIFRSLVEGLRIFVSAQPASNVPLSLFRVPRGGCVAWVLVIPTPRPQCATGPEADKGGEELIAHCLAFGELSTNCHDLPALHHLSHLPPPSDKRNAGHGQHGCLDHLQSRSFASDPALSLPVGRLRSDEPVLLLCQRARRLRNCSVCLWFSFRGLLPDRRSLSLGQCLLESAIQCDLPVRLHRSDV